MKRWTQCLTIAGLAAALLAAAAAVRAETWTLELKRLPPQGRARIFTGSMSDYYLRATYPQSFSAQIDPSGKLRGGMSGDGGRADAFQRIVKKEPAYESDQPFRGVVKLGTEEYAFALDAVSPHPPEKEAKQAEAAKTEPEKLSPDSPLAKLRERLLKTEAAAPKAVTYNRLYFDFNHNGDLTDDKVIEATSSDRQLLRTSSDDSERTTYVNFEFPQVEVTFDADGTKVEYAFTLRGYAQSSRSFGYVGVQLNAAAYREGDITLEGKKHHVVLLDFNSNGRFDNATRIRSDIRTPDGRIYPEYGDVLLLDPKLNNPGPGSPYDWASDDSHVPVANLVSIDGRYYDMKISPAGDKLTLTPSSVQTGNVTNPNDGFRAMVYGDKGFFKISGNKDTAVPLPEGEWKLLSYTIDLTGREQPRPPAAEKKEGAKKESSLIEALSDSLEALLSGPRASVRGPRYTSVAAQATAAYKAVKVCGGETVVLPFGPPYMPTVTGDFYQGGREGKQTLAGHVVGGFDRRGVYQPYGQWRAAGKARLHHHGP